MQDLYKFARVLGCQSEKVSSESFCDWNLIFEFGPGWCGGAGAGAGGRAGAAN